MATSNRRNAADENDSTDPRDDYIPMGTDTRGVSYCYDTITETVHIVHPDGTRQRKIIGERSINDFIDAVENTHGWDTQYLYKTAADAFGDSI